MNSAADFVLSSAFTFRAFITAVSIGFGSLIPIREGGFTVSFNVRSMESSGAVPVTMR